VITSPHELRRTFDVVVIGAGIAGVSAAHSLSSIPSVNSLALIDPRPPLSLTSDKSTECYRNWWPNRPMIQLMNRSIDILEELAALSGNVFGLNRRGYLFVTGDEVRFQRMVTEAHHTSTLGAGPVRFHPGPLPYRPSPIQGHSGAPEGADILVGGEEVTERFPFITSEAVGAIHVRRAGWLSAQQLGSWMLDRARSNGTELVRAEVSGVDVVQGAVQGVTLTDGSEIASRIVVNAAGPLAPAVGAMVGLDLPLFSEVHLKVAYRDHMGIVPRDAPMFIWSDPQILPWSEAEKSGLAEEGRDDLIGEMPVYCHGRPEGGADSPYLLALWEYHDDIREPTWPLPDDPLYPEVVMRGLTTMVPGLSRYADRLPHSTVDGGYYTKTPENRPLIGPAGPEGHFLIAGLSGFGIMVAAGAADLLARHIGETGLPDYSDAFAFSRYDDPGYSKAVGSAVDTGQL
jgi:glycine/D-amino acid oxidase-like deaminating enzyme